MARGCAGKAIADVFGGDYFLDHGGCEGAPDLENTTHMDGFGGLDMSLWDEFGEFLTDAGEYEQDIVREPIAYLMAGQTARFEQLNNGSYLVHYTGADWQRSGNTLVNEAVMRFITTYSA